MVRRQPKPVVSNYINILEDILKQHKKVLVASEIMFSNRMVFLVRISIHVKFTTVKYLGKSTTGNISKYLDNINNVYYIRGMYVGTFYMDGEFENIRIIIPGGSNLNTNSAAEHVP